MFERQFRELDEVEAQRRPPGEERDQRTRLLAKIAEEAQSDPSGTVLKVRELSPVVSEESAQLWRLYEALAPGASRWEDLFASELERVIGVCEASEKNESATSLLDGFMFLDRTASGALRSRIRKQLERALNSNSTPLRRAAANVAGSFLGDGDTALRSGLERALKDRDWRVRKFAEGALSDNDSLPPNYSPSVLDRIRRSLPGSSINYT